VSIDYTSLGLAKPEGTDQFTRSLLNANSDLIDWHLVFLAVTSGGMPYADINYGEVAFDEDGNPESQEVTGPGGLAGTITWSFAANQVTTVYSFTAPEGKSLTITTDLDTLEASGVTT